jgi:hypothetical protein
MSALDHARADVLGCLWATAGDAVPEWRTCYSTDGTEGPTGIAPVCKDDEHERTDGNVYGCCPEPVIEVEAPPLAEYLVALLNEDRRTAGGA